MRIKGKKAQGEYMVEVAIATVLYIVLFSVLMLFGGDLVIAVDATIKAENAVFACNNNLMGFVNSKNDQDIIFRDLIVESYIENDFAEFKKDAKNLLNEVYGDKPWTLSITDYEAKDVFSVSSGQFNNKDKFEECTTRIPLPCNKHEACYLVLNFKQKV